MTHENILNLSIEDRIEIIKNCMKQIESDKITILTGSNGSGKSLIRQQLAFKFAKELNCSPHGLTIDVSMAKRTASNPALVHWHRSWQMTQQNLPALRRSTISKHYLTASDRNMIGIHISS